VKRCKKCGDIKPVSEFYRATGTRDGLRGHCKACEDARHKAWYQKNQKRAIANVKRWQQANAERHNAYQRQYRADHPQQFRDGHLRRVFSLAGAQYQGLLDDQGGGCALCGRAPRAGRPLHVDHNHETGAVRGLLCFRCNVGIGHFGEDTLRIADAIAYLTRGRPALEPDRAERELFVELVCELLGARVSDAEGSPLVGSDGSVPTGVEQTSE
jgi:Recombination endonuclease VII